MTKYSIEASQINLSFNAVPILKNVNFKVKKGEVHALVGTNGAGKSSLMKVINGIYTKDSGHIALFGKQVNYQSPEDARQKGISMVFQDLSLIPSLTVAENIFLQTHPHRKGLLIDDAKSHKKVKELLKLIGVSTQIHPWQLVKNLSIGEQQTIEIAKALSHNPKILILDEPTASLSIKEIENLFRVIEVLKAQDISIIYITHYLQDIFKICDSLTFLKDGQVEFRKTTDEIDLPILVNAMSGGEDMQRSWNRKNINRQQAPLLDVQNITTKHINDVSLKLYPGEIVGIAGLLGSGRSELLRALSGIDTIQSGEILINKKSISIKSSTDAIENGIALVPENRREQGLVLDFPIAENMILSILNRLQKNFLVNISQKNNIVNHYIRLLKVKTLGPHQKVRFLSGGNQQKIVIARCLASHSQILLLDDPTFGIDIHAKTEIMKIIKDYASQGNAVIFVSSEFKEIAGFCDSVYIMKKGSITEYLQEYVSEDELLYKVQ